MAHTFDYNNGDVPTADTSVEAVVAAGCAYAKLSWFQLEPLGKFRLGLNMNPLPPPTYCTSSTSYGKYGGNN